MTDVDKTSQVFVLKYGANLRLHFNRFSLFYNKQSMITILVEVVVPKHCICNTQWEEAEQSVICLLFFSMTHSKVMQEASLLELFHINKHIPSYLLSAKSQAPHHIRELSSNGEVRALFLCTRPQETQNSTQAS